MSEAVETPDAEQNATRRWETWEDVRRDPLLRDLPHKIETNEHGQVVMSPPPVPKHGGRQSEIAYHLRTLLPQGRVATECPVKTSKGTKGVDVTWFTPERWKQAVDKSRSPVAPEICVEILSPSSTEAEIEEKRALYFEAGAEEVWLCSTEGAMRFFEREERERDQSPRAPDFPEQIDV